MTHKLDIDSAHSLARLGRYRAITEAYENAALDQLQSTSTDYRLLIADALALTGQSEAAEAIINTIPRTIKPELVAAHCEAIRALIAKDRGLIEEAVNRFQHASVLFRENGNIAQAALSSILLFRMASERQPPEAIDPLLTDVRTLVTRAGEPHLTALLHESVARQETQLANYDEARRHLRIAMGLVTAHPHAWIEQLCLINAFCICVYECDYREAEQFLVKAAALISLTGACEPEIQNNEGHLYLHLGNFGKAESALKKSSGSGSGKVAQSALDGLARLYLANGRFDESRVALDQLQALQTGNATSFPFRASLLTRIKLLLYQHSWEDAARVARMATHQAEIIHDRTLLAAALYLESHAVLNSDARKEACLKLLRAASAGVWGIREHQGAFAFMAAEMAAGEGFYKLEAQMRARAERIWREHENVCAQQEFKREANVASGQRPTYERAEDVAIAVMNSVASAIDLSYSPRLMGGELLELVKSLQCSKAPRIIESRAAYSEFSVENGDAKISLGACSGKNINFVCAVPADPVRANALADVFRFTQSLMALVHARENDRNRAALWPADPVTQEGSVFVAEEMQALLGTARKVAATNVSVLITGETGTGKEVLARTIHACSPRSKATFLPFNCSSTPKDTLDSQLFGHRRGAFTGATESFQGVIRAASGGTLFLDEIGDMSLDVQPKLLRFLESGEIHPVGETQPARVDVRVIAATNAPLETLVADGRFREDLFYRLNIVHLHVPPLRARRVEIPALAAFYLARHAAEFGKGDLRLAEETMEYLVLYRWPGNVRQLANEMRRLAALAESGAVLMPEHLSAPIAASRRTIPASERVLDPTEVVVRLDQPMAAAVQHLERAMMQYALKKCDGRMEDTAAMLGLSRKGLYLKRQRFGIEPPEAAGA